MDDFLLTARNRFLREGSEDDQREQKLRWKEATRILRTIEWRNRANLEAFNPDHVSFRSLKTMEFYAGLYLANYARQKDLQILSKLTNDDRWEWVWRFAVEMPTDARRDKVLCRTLSLLLQQPAEGRRPTELIYRCWHLFEYDRLLAHQMQLSEQEAKQLILKDPTGVQQALEAFRTGSRHTFRGLGKASRFVRCPKSGRPNTFDLGSPEGRGFPREHPQVHVEITPFEMQATTVTRTQYSRFDPRHGDAVKSVLDRLLRGRFPVVEVSWYDAFAFSKWLGAEYGLPTEAEWEFACRAGTTSQWSCGDNEEELADHAWYVKNLGYKRHRVGTKKPNVSGLYDMHGNVWEWCADWLDEDAYSGYEAGQRDPRGPAFGSWRVLRGGSFGSTSDLCRSAFRGRSRPDFVDHYDGFRVVCGLS